MYKNRVENDRIFFWNSHSFILRMRKFTRKRSRKIQNIYVILNFPALDFIIHKIKEWEFQKKILSFFTLFLYISLVNDVLWGIKKGKTIVAIIIFVITYFQSTTLLFHILKTKHMCQCVTESKINPVIKNIYNLITNWMTQEICS